MSHPYSWVHPIFYAFTLFDLCMMSPILQSVLQSIVIPAPQLGMTALLVGVFCYIFSFVSVMLFRRSFPSSHVFGEDPAVRRRCRLTPPSGVLTLG